MNVRFANKATVLPRGGGADGEAPFLLPKGSGIGWSAYHMHRLESIYGPDARTYRPERWEDIELYRSNVGSGFLDFNAGPRTCPGSKCQSITKLSTVGSADHSDVQRTLP